MKKKDKTANINMLHTGTLLDYHNSIGGLFCWNISLNVHLLTEWEGQTRKHLAQGHGVQTQSIRILSYDYHAFPFFFPNNKIHFRNVHLHCSF